MKTYLIVGGTSGIGLETVKILCENNKLIVFSRKNELTLDNENIKYYQVDVTKDLNEFPEISESLNGLVYLPGTITLKPFQNLKLEDFQYDMEINFYGAIKTVKKYLNNLKTSQKASIVLFSSVAAQTGMPYHSSISSAKSGLEGLTRSLAAEFAPYIRVNCIAPSITITPLAEKFINNETKLNALEERHPLKRIGSASEIAKLVEFLLSNNSEFITGQIITVDGGIGTLKIN
jgi:NAD(P)-dependent dehydrogenase (short-subunit alcohol dehydrogenase family)